MIRRLGTLTGKRIHFGYDRHVVSDLSLYLDMLSQHGSVVDAVDPRNLHYLRSAERMCTLLQDDADSFGVLCCYTGMGMSIAANKFDGVYAARCTSVADAEQARTINNANVLCLAAQNGLDVNRQIFEAFATTPYQGRRLEELSRITDFEGENRPSSSPVGAQNVRLIA